MFDLLELSIGSNSESGFKLKRFSSYENYLKSILGSVSCCEITLRRTAYWLLQCRHVILRKKNDLGSPVSLPSISQKISTWKNLARVPADGEHGPPGRRQSVKKAVVRRVLWCWSDGQGNNKQQWPSQNLGRTNNRSQIIIMGTWIHSLSSFSLAESQ